MIKVSLYDSYKRIFDVVLSVLLLPCTLPICLFFAAIFWILNRENPLFVQIRVGRHQKLFRLVKLRTMSSKTSDKPTHEIDRDTISPIGKLMRSLKVDELPQLFNVIKGDMSLVGPRPCLPTQVEIVEHRSMKGIYKLRPGITGIAQISGVDMSNPERLAENDLEYLQNQSLGLDIALIVKTVVGAGRGDRTV